MVMINSVERFPDDDPPSFPTFRVCGTYKGKPFRILVGTNLDDNEADFETEEGFLDLYEEVDEQQAFFDAIYESLAYKEAVEAYKLVKT